MSYNFAKGIEVLDQQIDSRIEAYFSSCVHCGLCAEACLFYTETSDPRYTPIYKLEPMRRLWREKHTFWGKFLIKMGLSQPLKEQDFADWETLVYDSCTMCGRCSMVCPVGIDITYMIRKEREGFSAAGYTPVGLQEATKRALTIGSPMGVTLKTLKAALVHVEKSTGLKIPLDQSGADYMALFSSMEVVNFPEYIESVARIFAAANVSWTISSEAFEATNSGIQIGSHDAAKEIVSRVVIAAEALGVKYVISPECGHAYTAIRWEGPNLIGRAYKFEVIHILELLDQLQKEGRLQFTGKTDTPLTFHDPCQIVRRGGVIESPRTLLDSVSSGFVEMTDHGSMNWCCGGGGGVSANERAEDLRLKVFDRKKQQIESLGVTTMVTSCANCRIVLEEGIEDREMDVEVIGLTELLAEYLMDNSTPAA
ncbi:(Fe-S)-binding protein [Sedimenticola selenatireducens]|uniref:(Fe-S)-binding protein n=1 Tax=Sedimenticola selenatireducens TaxID=191960 RepID=A0A557S026_9GAMM|nr:(Fe-S)-binding protein [Sedimenticola selenatireducens]TVO70728.1 (Fe-S)-binding protein [Sedimenticola selenatireducens]TVT65648.1 MAG: (Fe-S)-binding protein [Sedimenticola selenatireducens]